jgi:hypothetical protein
MGTVSRYLGYNCFYADGGFLYGENFLTHCEKNSPQQKKDRDGLTPLNKFKIENENV